MPPGPGVHPFRQTASTSTSTAADEVDIVAVHDVGDDPVGTWTHARTGANWLRDLVPLTITAARVLTFAYEATPDDFFGPNAHTFIQRTAETFVQRLYANRRLAGALKRPIVFVAHGLGGVIVKRALIYSSTRVAHRVEHLLDAYHSTFAIIFFGTPHDHAKLSSWKAAGLSSLMRSTALRDPEDTGAFRTVSADFGPHINSFHLFFFWEELPTMTSGSHAEFVVEQTSAVMQLDNSEKASIHANHADMVKFEDAECTSYRTVLEALVRYCEDAVPFIRRRWEQAEIQLQKFRENEARELAGISYDVHSDPDSPMLGSFQGPVAQGPFHPPTSAIDNFVGRKAMLHTIYKKFFPSEGSVYSARKSFVLYGMGGCGKTELCSKFAHAYRNYYHAVFTIRAASHKTIEDSFKRIAIEEGLHPTESWGRYVLDQQKNPWLLIIDNADDQDLPLDPLLSQSELCHVLISTRNRRFQKHGTLGSLEIKGLTENEALELLLTRADIPQPWDQSTRRQGNRITRSLGYLALALVHAGNCICQQMCTLESYLGLHTKTRNMIQRLGTSDASIRREDGSGTEDMDMVRTVYSTFDVSFHNLQKRQSIKSQDAVEILRLSAFYHFENIPQMVFERAINNRQNADSDSIDNFLSSWLRYLGILPQVVCLPRFLSQDRELLDESRITWALDELQSLSLVNRNARDESFSMHPLLHQWARDRLSKDETSAWVSASLNTLLEAVTLRIAAPSNDDDDHAKVDGAFHESILPHLSACLNQHSDPISSATVNSWWLSMIFWTFINPHRPHMVRAELLNAGKCAVVFGERGQFEQAAAYLESVNKALLNLRGPRHESTMFVQIRLSNLYWGLGRLEESIDLHDRVLKARTHVNGPHHKQTLIVKASLGQTYWLHGDYLRSLAILSSTTETMKIVLGEDNSHTLAALDNYGVALGSWRRAEESMHIHKQVLDIRIKTLGHDHLDTLFTKMYLGMALLDLQKLDEAQSLLQVVYKKRQQLLGKEHPWTLWTLCYLTKIYTEMGSLQKAEELLLWGIDAGKRSLGKGHLGVLMGRGYLAVVYNRQGRLAEAETLSKKTLKGLVRNRGYAHPDTIFCLWKMAILHRRQRKISDAIDDCKLALEHVDARLTREHPLAKDLEKLLNELSIDMEDIAELEGGEDQGRDSLSRRPQTW